MLLVEGVVAVALGVALSDDYPVGVPVLTEDVASTVAQGLELVLDAEARHLRYLCLASLGGGRVRVLLREYLVKAAEKLGSVDFNAAVADCLGPVVGDVALVGA